MSRTRDIPSLFLSPKLTQHMIGFDELFKRIESFADSAVTVTYPPKNVIELSEHENIVQFATAGYSKEELSVTRKDNVVTVSGSKTQESKELEKTINYLIKGISTKDFSHDILVPENSEIQVEYKDGLLSIYIRVQKKEPDIKVLTIQ